MSDQQSGETRAVSSSGATSLWKPPQTTTIGRPQAFTRRSLGIGTLLVVLLAIATPVNDWGLNGTYLYGNHLPLVGTLLVLAFGAVVNPLLGAKRLRLGEMVVILSMVLVLGGVVSSGLMRVLPGVLAGPAQRLVVDPNLAPFASRDGEPARLSPRLFVGIPEEGPIDPSDPEHRLIIDGYWGGLGQGAPVVSHRGEVTWSDRHGTHRAVAVGGELATRLAGQPGYIDLERSRIGRVLAGRRAGERIAGPDGPLTVIAVSAPSTPWFAWVVPLLAWLPLIAAGLVACLAIAALVRKQWIEHERLPFPIARVMLSYLDAPLHGRRFSALYYRPGFWIAFLVPVLVFASQGLQTWGVLPLSIPTKIDMQPAFRSEPWLQVWDHFYLFQGHIFFSVIALTFFLPLDIAFSLWFFFVLTNGVVMVLRTKLGLPVTYDQAIHASAGGWGVMCLLILWVGRHWYWKLLRAAVRGTTDAEVRETARYVWLLLGCILAMALWLVATGAEALHALAAVLLFLGFILVLARLVAEAGVAQVATPTAATLTQTIFLATGFSAPLTALLPLVYIGSTLFAEQRENLLPYALHAEHMARQTKVDGAVSRWKWTGLLAAVLAVGGLLALVTMLSLSYHRSGHPDWYWQWGIINNGLGPLGTITEESPSPLPRGDMAACYGTGALITAGLGLARLSITGWVLHPLGYIASTSWAARILWFSFFIGWLAKLLVMRYGGVVVYQRLKPVALGLIAGEAVVTGLFLVLQILLYLIGLEPAAIPRFLPQ